eukprot:CAMPEP_0176058566 /NCGR_PEP_ID=MMETSP0120_2-20121206/29181_1 /TAXON_ID=160619 /ORGANISM="Kryptoperidinium foliaceum, Strain CCMP 1326" /LENGTH=1562 /DNA_ID=CAMNT_0017392095 /DNA_START=32 /DNA_END=4720 /DNA_ORIENTATION=+
MSNRRKPELACRRATWISLWVGSCCHLADSYALTRPSFLPKGQRTSMNDSMKRSCLSMVYAPPGSGYATPEDEKSELPDSYEPMMEYPGTMRPGRTPENMPPIADTDPDPVPWPHFQQIEWHHRWDPPHPHPIPMEEFIEQQGRWATPEMEAAMRAGNRRDARRRREMDESKKRENLIMDDDEDDQDEPQDLGEGMFGQLGSAADQAMTAAAVSPEEEEDTGEGEDDDSSLGDFLLDLGLDSFDDDEEDGGDDLDGESKIATKKQSRTSLEDVTIGDDDEDESVEDDTTSTDVTASIDVEEDDDMDLALDDEDDLTDDGVSTVPLEDFGDNEGLDTEDFFDDGGFDFDTLWRWSKDKLTNDPSMADEARRFLNGVASRHISGVLKSVAGSSRTTVYDDARFRDLAEGRKPWAHFAGKAASRFSEHSKALARRPFEEFSQLLWMYFKLDFALDAGSLWKFMQTLEEGSDCLASRFNMLAPPGSTLRMCMGEKAAGENQLELGEYDRLLKYFGFFNPSYQSLVRRGRALAETRRRFRSASAPNCSNVDGAQARAFDLFMGLLEATVKLISMFGAPSDLSTEEVIMEIGQQCGGHHVHQRLFGRVIEAVQRMDHSKAEGFGLAQLLDCARELGKSGQMLAHKLERKWAQASLLDGVCSAIQGLLQRAAPSGWAAALKGLDTVIFALEYIGREDLDLAYEQFEAECRCQQQDAMLELLLCAKQIYCHPLAGSDPTSISPFDDIAEVILRNAPPLESRVVWRGALFEPEDWDRILAIAGAAAETMRERYNVLMLPHHTQMITLVMFAIRTCGARFAGVAGKRLPKTMLARIGTGEGKSMVIAMLAAFVALRGLRAHVVNDNRVLAQRDFRTNLPLFERLGIVASDDRSDLKSESVQVVYCTGDDVEKSCLESLIEGKVEELEAGLKQAVLIVDEVDGLIFDKGTVSNEVFEHHEYSGWVNNWLRQLDLNGRIERDWEDFRANGDCSMTIQREVEEAYRQIGSRTEGVDYVVRGDMPYMTDRKTGLIKEDAWSLWLEVLKRHRRDGAYNVQYKYVKAVLCRLQCFMSYACIFGLTGSLGQTSEMAYLQEHYEAVTFNAPYFLDTCRAEPMTTGRPVVGDRVVVKTENSEGSMNPARVGTVGLVGRIVEDHPRSKTYTLEFGDGRKLAYQEHWVAPGRFQGRHLPRQVGEAEPLSNRDAQEEAIVELAVQKSLQVPVLIVMKDSDSVQRLAASLRERLVESGLLPYVGAEETSVVELLHNPRDPFDFVHRVELATEPLPEHLFEPPVGTIIGDFDGKYVEALREDDVGLKKASSGSEEEFDNFEVGDAESPFQMLRAPRRKSAAPDRPQQQWRITVATAEGGRGHDYRVTDPAVDEHGGLMLILSWVPWSEREWIQFLGRTARQDHCGQYAVLLNGEEENVKAALAQRLPGESPVRCILRKGDQDTAQTLQGKGSEIKKGRLMHKFTSRYWTLHKVDRTSKNQDWEWKRLCENYLEQNTDQIQQTFCSVIVPPKALILGFAKINPETPTRPGLSEWVCRSCGTVNIFPSPGADQQMPTVRCGHCGVTSD